MRFKLIKLNLFQVKMSALKTFRVKIKLSKKMKQNRPIPQWITALGGFLTIHDSHGYSRWEKLITTDTVVRGRTVVGLYFSADWCQPCKLFAPLLKKLHASTRAHCTDANRNIPPFEIVLVSRCKEARDTEQYFADMPWAATLCADPKALHMSVLS